MLTIALMLGLAYLMNYSGHDVHARPRARIERQRVSVLQRGGRLARRVPDGQLTPSAERAVRQPPGRHRQRALASIRS